MGEQGVSLENMFNMENMEMFSCSPTEMFSGSPTDIFSGSPTLFTLVTACISTVEKIITYAIGEHDPGSAQNWKKSNDLCSPGNLKH